MDGTTSNTDLLDRLKNLTPGQMLEIQYRLEAAGYTITPYLPSPTASRTEIAIAVIRLAEQHKGALEVLHKTLAHLLDAPRSSLLPKPGLKTAETVHPHLVNRQEQLNVLEDAWDAYLADKPANPKQRPPLLCILHGPDEEYGGFVQRLAQEFLPARLPAGTPFKSDILLPLANTKRLHQCLQADLSDYFHPYRADYALLVEVNLYDSDWFGNRRRNISDYLFGSWRPQTVTETDPCPAGKHGNLLECFLRYWHQHLASLSGPHPCVVCVCFQYTTGNRQSARAAQYFANLENCQDLHRFTERFKLPGVVLPRLGSVSMTDANKWLNHPWVRKHPAFQKERLRAGIAELYAHTPYHPMGPLSQRLAQLLQPT